MSLDTRYLRSDDHTWTAPGRKAGVLPSIPKGMVVNAPEFVIAKQGPSDPNNLYALVYWVRNDSTVTSYTVYADGVQIGTVGPFVPPNLVTGAFVDDTYNKCQFKHTLPNTTVAGTTVKYTVKATNGSGTSAESGGCSVTFVVAPSTGSRAVVASAQAGATAIARLRAAITAAMALANNPLSPAVVVVDEAITEATEITDRINWGACNDICLRGPSSASRTIIKSSFAGNTTNVCTTDKMVMQITGTTSAVLTNFANSVSVDDRITPVSSVSGLAVGQVYYWYDNRVPNQGSTYSNTLQIDVLNNGKVMDPCTRRDNRRCFSMNIIDSIDATALTVTWRYPFSQQHDADTAWTKLTAGMRNRMEYLAFEGTDPAAVSWQTLISHTKQWGLTITECTSRWPGRNFIESVDTGQFHFIANDLTARQHDTTTSDSCKYAVSTYRNDGTFALGNVFGTSGQRYISSPMTYEFAQKFLVIGNAMYGCLNYAVNEHGGGGRHFIIANNRFEDCAWQSDNAGTPFGAVFLGHPQWGFAGFGLINNNLFLNNNFDIVMYQNPYDITIKYNVSRGLKAASAGGGIGSRFLTTFGWGNEVDTPLDTSPLKYGTMYLVVSRNHVSGVVATAGAGGKVPTGIELGLDMGGATGFRYIGVKKASVHNNYLALPVGSTMIRVWGTANDNGGNPRSRDYRVHDNAGSGAVTFDNSTLAEYIANNAGSAVAVGSAPSAVVDYDHTIWASALREMS